MKNNKSRKPSFHWKGATALFLLGLGIVGFLWVFLPTPTETIQLDLQEIRVPLEEGQSALLQESYQIKITAPRLIKAGKIFGYSFALIPDNQIVNVTAQDVDIYTQYQVNLVLLPDFENAMINPPGSMTTALSSSQEPAMLWKMEATGSEPVTGIFWVYLDFIPLEPTVDSFSTAVLARSVDIPVQSMLGLNTNAVAILSTASLLIALFLGTPQLRFFRKDQNAES